MISIDRWRVFFPLRLKRALKRQGAQALNALDALRRLLAAEHFPFLLAVLAVVLTASTLGRGWVGDDVIHRSILLSSTLGQSMRSLFTFLSPERNPALMDAGTAPWWTLPEARISFFRPLAVLTHWLDYRLWPDVPLLMHAQSILWYALLCLVAARFYRRFVGHSWIAGLAALLFTVDSAHVNAVASLSSRNVLLTGLFGMLVLLAHDRWRRERWKAGALWGPFLLALALLSAEASVAVGAYLAAYALFLDRGPWRQRVVSLLPYLAVVVLWRVVYQSMGYGAWGSGFYVDPAQEPLRFARLMLERVPLLLLGQWAGADPGLYTALSVRTDVVFWPFAFLFLLAVGVVLWPLLRRDRQACFLALGMLLSTVPACAIRIPSGRLLIFVGLGALGLMAQFFGGMLDRMAWLPAHRLWRVPAWILCAALLWIHLVVSPVSMTAAVGVQDPFFENIVDLEPLSEARPEVVVIVNIPSPGHIIYIPDARRVEGEEAPAHLRVLSPGCFGVEVTRVDTTTLLVRPDHGYLIPPGEGIGESVDDLPPAHLAYAYQYGDSFFRSHEFPMALGERVELTSMTVTVTRMTDDGRPAEVLVSFSRPLEDPSIQWLYWDWQREAYALFDLPAVGQTVRVDGPFDE